MYSTLDDLYQDKPQTLIQDWCRDSEDTGSEWQDRATDAIVKADGVINGYLGGRYSVPLDPVPEVVKGMGVDIAVYYCLSRRGFDKDSADYAIVKRYDDDIKLLKDLSTGKAQLGIETEEGSSNPPAGVKYNAPKSRFDLRGFGG